MAMGRRTLRHGAGSWGAVRLQESLRARQGGDRACQKAVPLRWQHHWHRVSNRLAAPGRRLEADGWSIPLHLCGASTFAPLVQPPMRQAPYGSAWLSTHHRPAPPHCSPEAPTGRPGTGAPVHSGPTSRSCHTADTVRVGPLFVERDRHQHPDLLGAQTRPTRPSHPAQKRIAYRQRATSTPGGSAEVTKVPVPCRRTTSPSCSSWA